MLRSVSHQEVTPRGDAFVAAHTFSRPAFFVLVFLSNNTDFFTLFLFSRVPGKFFPYIFHTRHSSQARMRIKCPPPPNAALFPPPFPQGKKSQLRCFHFMASVGKCFFWGG